MKPDVYNAATRCAREKKQFFLLRLVVVWHWFRAREKYMLCPPPQALRRVVKNRARSLTIGFAKGWELGLRRCVNHNDTGHRLFLPWVMSSFLKRDQRVDGKWRAQRGMLSWSRELAGEKCKEGGASGGARGWRVNFEDRRERGGSTSSRILHGHGEGLREESLN